MEGRYDIGDLLAKLPLEDVVQRLGMATERRGATTQALCPFHQDTRPSLNLYPADGAATAHYHCFVCGAHGNAIDLVKKVLGLEFLPAVEWLAPQFGIKPPSRQSKQRAANAAASETALKFALRIYDEQHDDPRFMAWCAEREFDRNFLYEQGLRCITRGVLVEALQSKSVGERTELTDGLQTLGLIKRLQQRSAPVQWKLNLHDQFQDCFHDGRVVIPIRSGSAKQPEFPGFAGRALQGVPPEGVAKYLLTSGFEKSKGLFNEPSAFNAVKKAFKAHLPARLYLVEGFLDALRLQSLGLPAVALMGTSLGKEPMERLKKLAEESESSAELAYILFLDNDPAGFAGTDRLVRRLLDLRGVNLRWVGMPWRSTPVLGKDPDTCLRGVHTPEQAITWLQPFDMPAEAVLLTQALGGQDASDLLPERFAHLAPTVRERALFRVGMALRRLYGRRPAEVAAARLKVFAWDWAQQLHAELVLSETSHRTLPARGLYLEETLPRVALARSLAYHGARRGELPCDEEVWQTLGGNARLFDQVALDRLQAMMAGDRSWKQAAPFDAVHLPRKLTADPKVLDDPRLKVMPHPADLLVQQMVLNELLSQRHDRPSASGQAFSDCIPAVRWYASRREVLVTGLSAALNEFDDELDLPKTLSFGYQIDMDVLEGDQTPSDQGMFRPFGQCWREFMTSLSKQCHAIGPRVHVLRLDAKRYYDSIQRFVVRDALLTPMNQALASHGVPEGFGRIFGLLEAGATPWDAALEAKLERLLVGLIFHHEYRDPDAEGTPQRSSELVGIAQGPVLSAYIGTIALFPVDEAARGFIHGTAEKGPDGPSRPRAGYARYVDDIVLFADSEDLLTQLRELLQAKAAERSIDLIHKGDRVRAGSPQQVMRQLNDGRGLAPSVPAWGAPLVGDGETDYSLGGELPEVDRQCALQMLRRVALMHESKDIAVQVKAVLGAPDLRAGDLGLCARWLWWQVAATASSVATPVSLWERFWDLWNEVCGEHLWASAFAQLGYHWLFAVEGLDKLLDSHPWQESGKFLSELEADRKRRVDLARQVCEPAFIDQVNPATNLDHVRRRVCLVVRKAHRLLGNPGPMLALPPQQGGPLTAIEWLCLAGQSLAQQDTAQHQNTANQPLNALWGRRPQRSRDDGLARAHEVIDQLVPPEKDGSGTSLGGTAPAVGLAIDFVLNSSPPKNGLPTLTHRFPRLLSQFGAEKQLIPHLPTVSEIAASLYAIGAQPSAGGRALYRYSLQVSDSSPPARGIEQRFAQVTMRAEPPCPADETTVRFVEQESEAQQLVVAKSAEPRPWTELAPAAIGTQHTQVPITHRAVRLYHALLAIHQMTVDGDRTLAYVPFRPQLFQQVQGDHTTLFLLAEPVKRDQLGVNAWYHDLDDRVQSVTVPFAGAELWRVGWAVADVLGVAADMAGETGERDEQLDERKTPGEAGSAEAAETHAKQEVEAYVLRQQLRKLQGSYLSSAQIDSIRGTEDKLPRTVKRALASLQKFPAHLSLDAQVRHLLELEAESRAMALRLEHRSGDDMRYVLHQVFPEALNRLPLWALQGLPLQPPAGQPALRPELGLMLALYQVLYPATGVVLDGNAASLRVALVLTAVGIGLRGSVAALWGYAQPSGIARMPEHLNLPNSWSIADMERIDPQGDYSAMRKRLLDGDWPALSKASPWQWILALIGLLDAGLPQAFALPDLMPVYQALAHWQTAPAVAIREEERVEEQEAIWPFDTLPAFSLQRCDEVMAALPKALCALDALRGMRVVNVQGQKFGRHPHTDEFTDDSGASWQMSTPQFTSLFANTLPQRSFGRRKLTLWSETRSSGDNELLAVHTLDHKLGKWFSFEDAVPAVPSGAPLPPSAPRNTAVQRSTAADAGEVPVPSLLPGEVGERAQHSQADEDSESGAPAGPAVSGAALLDRLKEWQINSWSKRFGVGRTTEDEDLTAHGHMRVALFQWRVDDSYSHPIGEVGLGGLPLAPAAQKELQAHLAAKSDFAAVHKAAKRGLEFHWQDDRTVLSWPEHRRRVLLGQALRACLELKVQLLVLPEISVRPDTVEWLKGELRHHPGLAVLAGTFRQFESASNHTEHLKEKLTLLWTPANPQADDFGLRGDDRVMQFQRDKKYRAVAAHELFRPGGDVLAPLYREERVLDELRGIWNGARTFDQTKALMQALIHGPQKLRYCMELICSELFLLTSPANRRPLVQDLAKLLRQFGLDATQTAKLVDDDMLALGNFLTVSQANRERRSVLLVPACTSRSNDYWHAGQASVLASGTATVFCNAVSKGLSVGGSCFIGCDSVQKPKEHPGIVRLLTPYHGWHHGILQPSCQGALSERDQALVVVDLDPVHLVSGKPRPQLLPEPVSLVAYLPIVEVLRKEDNASALVAALQDQLKDDEGGQTLRRLLNAEAFPTPCEALHARKCFEDALDELLKAKKSGSLTAESGGPALDAFAGFFGDPAAVRQRIMVCLQDHHQQPAPLTKADGLDLVPAWLDFLVADLTWKQPDDEQARDKQPAIRVPPWQHALDHLSAGEGSTRGGDPTAI